MSNNLRLEVLTDRNYRPTAGDFVTRLACRIHVSDFVESLPLDICLLIDRSLSMTGAKIEAAREAAQKLVSGLRNGDRLSILAFSTNVVRMAEQVVVSEQSRPMLHECLDELSAGGVTRLDLAMEQAEKMLDNPHAYLPMILLLSDGAPTNQAGYVLPDESCEGFKNQLAQFFAKNNVVTTTIGLGDAEDCLAPFLESCAEAGGGIFYHEKDPSNLASRFMEEFHRIKDTAVTRVRLHLKDIHGHLRRAASVLPDVRELKPQEDENGVVLDAGVLQKGEEHVFLLEVVSPPGEAGKVALCQIQATWCIEDTEESSSPSASLLEYTDEESLLNKPPHADVTRYRDLYSAFFQTRKAVENIRDGGDARKTRTLLQGAAKTTRKLGLSKQTKVLEALDLQVESGGQVDANQLTAAAVGSRKTRVLTQGGC